jgi:2-hydroxychromene-2-carboxylate isomerase
MSITFWLDPGCPYTWRTSRWIRDVAARHGEKVHWRWLSLAVLDEQNDPTTGKHAWAHGALRALAATDRRHGQAAVDRLYTALGRRVHDERAAKTMDVLAEALAEAGLPSELAAAADDPSLDAVVRESHDAAQDRVDAQAGSPVTAIGDGPAFFGPVVSAAPEAGDADRLFEAVRLLSSVPQFRELKRAR